VALSLFAHDAGPLGPDQDVTEAVQGLPSWFEPVARAVRSATGTEVVLVVGAASAMVLWVRGWRAEAVALVVLLVLLPFAQSGLKDLVDRPRPDPLLIDRKTGFGSESYPSGHVMSGTVLYGYLLVLALRCGGRGWGLGAAALCALLALNAVANVYMGVHWPTDVLGGMLWALVLLLPAIVMLRATRAAPDG
jgi:undecaprenyl-diphosphatase